MSTLLARKARRDLAQHKGPFLALVVMITLGVATLTSVYGAYANLRETVDETYADLRFHDALLDLRPTTRAALAGLDAAAGVAAWEARLVVELPATFDGERPPVMARVSSLPATGAPAIDALRYVRGAAPAPGTGDVAIEAGFAAHHDVRVGDTVRVLAPGGPTEARVAGVATSPEYLWPAKTAQEHMPDVLRRWGAFWMREDALQRLAGQPAAVNQVALDGEGSADAAIRGATDALGAGSVLRAEPRERQASNVVFGLLVNAVSQMAYVLPLLFLGIVGLGTYVLLTRLVHEQRANIGLLSALGYGPRAILLHYLTFAPLLAGAGAILGFASGYALSFRVTRIFGSYVSLGEIPVRLRFDLLLVGFLLSLGFALAASFLPALAASRLKPSEAMRPPVPPAGARSPLERLAPRAPASVRLGLRNVARNPRRAAFTVLGVALAVSVLVIPQVVIDSLDNATEVAIVRVQRADEILILREPASESDIARVADLPGVDAVEPLVQLQASFLRAGTARDVTIMGLSPASELMQLADAEGARWRASADGILLSRVFERDGIEAGDTIRLFGEPVRVLAFVQASGTSGFVALETAERWAATPGAANQVMLRRDAGADPDAVRDAVEAALPVAATLDLAQSIRDTREMLRLYYAMVTILLAFGIAIGGAIVLNTVSINVLEESRDFATLRTLGVPTRELVAQTTTETLALTAPGALLGLALGVALARYFVGAFASDLFVLDMRVRPVTLLVAFAGGLVVALLSQIPSLRQIARLDLARAVRERSA